MAKLSPRTQPENSPIAAWRITFADLLTLLLSFFVLRCSMLTFGTVGSVPSFLAIEPVEVRNSVVGLSPSPLRTLSANVIFDPNAPERVLFPTDLFSEGSDEFTFNGISAVQAVCERIKHRKRNVTVSVYSGDNPSICLSNQTCSVSNWELSARRAEAVSRQMIDAGVEATTISVMGYAISPPNSLEGEFNPSRANEHRNQRVELLITADSYEGIGPDKTRGEI